MEDESTSKTWKLKVSKSYLELYPVLALVCLLTFPQKGIAL